MVYLRKTFKKYTNQCSISFIKANSQQSSFFFWQTLQIFEKYKEQVDFPRPNKTESVVETEWKECFEKAND